MKEGGLLAKHRRMKGRIFQIDKLYLNGIILIFVPGLISFLKNHDSCNKLK